jgi:ribosomal subunit interface protein
MKLPLQVTFRNMDTSDVLEANIREHAARLNKFFDHIMHCDVVVEEAHRRHHKGNLYHVRIDITVPDKEIVVDREPDKHSAHEDPYVAVRDAFDAATRQLEDYARRRSQRVKSHEWQPEGFVTELEPLLDCGRIGSDEGRSIYFHRNSVADGGFDRLEVGTRVRYVESEGDEGPQASMVKIIGSPVHAST